MLQDVSERAIPLGELQGPEHCSPRTEGDQCVHSYYHATDTTLGPSAIFLIHRLRQKHKKSNF